MWHEFGALLADLKGGEVAVSYDDRRPGDQPCYVSDIRKAAAVIGWKPLIDKDAGIKRLWDWVASNPDILGLAAGEARRVSPKETIVPAGE